jgi:hypothetical protein
MNPGEKDMLVRQTYPHQQRHGCNRYNCEVNPFSVTWS